MPTALARITADDAALDPVRDRFRGALLGLAVGDALGAAVEFKPPGTFSPPTELCGGGPFGLKPGEWTDDTSQALCLAESLVAKRDLDPSDCMHRLHRWMTQGHLSVNGRCFDIGESSAASLRRFKTTGDPFQGQPDRDTNGCLMRLAPVPLAFAGAPATAVARAVVSARLTHGGPGAISAVRYLAALIVGAVRGPDPAAVLSGLYAPDGAASAAWADSLAADVRDIATGAWRLPPRASFKAVECLHAALWAVRGAADYESAVCRAVNLGNDADTVGAVAGQLAGAVWGYAAIPDRWRRAVAWHGWLVSVADQLYALSGLRPAPPLPE